MNIMPYLSRYVYLVPVSVDLYLIFNLATVQRISFFAYRPNRKDAYPTKVVKHNKKPFKPKGLFS